jgi:transcriptional regulator with XRE-family HTH domain
MGQLVAAVGLKKNSFGKKIGVSPTSIGYIIGEKQNKPSFDLLEKVAKAFPEVRMEWLIRGEGSILKASEENDSDCREELKHLGLKFKDLERDYERLQLSYDRQVRLNAAGTQGE